MQTRRLPVRKWIREDVLDRTAEASRPFLNGLPERMMAIDVAESQREISMVESTRRKTQVQCDFDRVAAIDGVGRFLYGLLKIHLLRLGLQIVGGVVLGISSHSLVAQEVVIMNEVGIGMDAALIFAPYLVLLSVFF